MFKTMLVERRRRAIIMRENVACRALIHRSLQLGPFRPIDIYEDSHDDDDDAYEPTGSVAPAASDAPTATPAPAGYLPPRVIGRALDVFNAPGSTREKFQALLNSSNLGPGDVEELNPQLWEDLRLDSAGAEYELFGRDQAEEEAQGTSQVLDRLPGLSEAAGPSTAIKTN